MVSPFYIYSDILFSTIFNQKAYRLHGTELAPATQQLYCYDLLRVIEENWVRLLLDVFAPLKPRLFGYFRQYVGNAVGYDTDTHAKKGAAKPFQESEPVIGMVITIAKQQIKFRANQKLLRRKCWNNELFWFRACTECISPNHIGTNDSLELKRETVKIIVSVSTRHRITDSESTYMESDWLIDEIVCLIMHQRR